MDKQSENELRVFKKFAQICPYSINLATIEKRNHPEPDILCKLSDGTAIAFEIVECLDRSLSRSIYNSCELGRAFYNEIEKLPDDEKNRVKSKFGDALISIVFHRDVSLIKKRRLVKQIFEQLWTVENEKKIQEMEKSFAFLSPQESEQFLKIIENENITEDELLKREPFSKSVVQEFNLKLPKNLRDYVKRITFFFPGLSDGPSFDITEAVWFTSPIEKRIDEKIKKKYKTEHKTELLVYYELQPELPADHWILPRIGSVTDNLENTIFKRVWLYSVTQDKIIYVFPVYVE